MAFRGWYCEQIEKIRQLPTPLLIILVLSRFVFGFGLGALVAGSANKKKQPWKTIGGITMGAATAMVVPTAVRIFTHKGQEA